MRIDEAFEGYIDRAAEALRAGDGNRACDLLFQAAALTMQSPRALLPLMSMDCFLRFGRTACDLVKNPSMQGDVASPAWRVFKDVLACSEVMAREVADGAEHAMGYTDMDLFVPFIEMLVGLDVDDESRGVILRTCFVIALQIVQSFQSEKRKLHRQPCAVVDRLEALLRMLFDASARVSNSALKLHVAVLLNTLMVASWVVGSSVGAMSFAVSHVDEHLREKVERFEDWLMSFMTETRGRSRQKIISDGVAAVGRTKPLAVFLLAPLQCPELQMSSPPLFDSDCANYADAIVKRLRHHLSDIRFLSLVMSQALRFRKVVEKELHPIMSRVGVAALERAGLKDVLKVMDKQPLLDHKHVITVALARVRSIFEARPSLPVRAERCLRQPLRAEVVEETVAELEERVAVEETVAELEERVAGREEPPSSRACAWCGACGDLKRCSRCKRVWYCSEECHSKHWHEGGHKPSGAGTGDPRSCIPSKACAACGSRGAPGSKLRPCGRCKSARYCSEECQAQHWNQGGHKDECKKLAKALLLGVPAVK